MLRVSSNTNKQDVDLAAVKAGENIDSGVEGGSELTAFAEAVVRGGDNIIAQARGRVVDVLGREATVDAAGVIGNFERMVRIADGTGIPLDKPVAMMTAEMRDTIGVNDFEAAKHTPAVSTVERLFGRLLQRMMPLVRYMMKTKKKSEA